MPLVSANGRTGERIDKYAQSLFNAIKGMGAIDNESDEWFLAIVNPVPWQASLGSFVEGKLQVCLRDAVWKKVYTGNYGKCKDNFESIIQNMPKNAIIINACTGGKKLFEKYEDISKPNNCPINRFVMESIRKKRHATHKVFFTNHPSAWGLKMHSNLYFANWENNICKLEDGTNFAKGVTR